MERNFKGGHSIELSELYLESSMSTLESSTERILAGVTHCCAIFGLFLAFFLHFGGLRYFSRGSNRSQSIDLIKIYLESSMRALES